MANAPVDPSVLERLPVFAGLNDTERGAIAAISTAEEICAGEVLFRESDPSVDVYFVIKGRVSLSMRVDGSGEITVLSLGPGELVGWSALLDGKRVATARVIQGGTLLRIHGARLHALCEADSRIGYALMKQVFAALAQRLHDTRIQLLDMFGKKGER